VRILLFGKTGQLGWELARALPVLGEVAAYGRSELDLMRPDRLVSVVRAEKPDVIVNAAAYTAVDRAESEPELAFAVNATAPGIMAEEAKQAGALLIHYSTDYVFDGTKQGPYVEDDEPNPLGVYGRSKLGGERAIVAAGCRHLILRTSWVYGPRGDNFFLTIRRLAAQRDELRVVDDQIGAPTTANMISDATARILAATPDVVGLFHLTAAGVVSRFGFAAAIVREVGLPTRIVPVPSGEFATPARRPLNSVLDNGALERTFGLRLPPWESGLADCVQTLAHERSQRP